MKKGLSTYFAIYFLLSVLIISFVGAEDGDVEKIIRSSDITVHGLDLNGIMDEIVKDTFAKIPEPKNKEGYLEQDIPLVCWLVDNTSFLKRKGFSALAASISKAFQKQKVFKMSVVKFAAKPEITCELTDSLGDVVNKGISSAFNRTDDSCKDYCAAIRFCVNSIKGGSNKKKYIIVFTAENNELESDLEGTLKLLNENNITLVAISGGSILSNPDTEPYGEIPPESRVYRADSPELELEFYNPYLERWYPGGVDGGGNVSPNAVFYTENYPYYNTNVFSGYGVYGLSRLAAYTGGKYYMYSPGGDKGTSFCELHYCAWCGSNKKEHSAGDGCSSPYDKFLPVMAPVLLSRDDFKYRYGGDPLFKILNKSVGKKDSWMSANLPPFFDSDGNLTSFYHDQVEKGYSALNELIKTIEDTLAEKGNEGNIRFRNHLEVSLANLYMERFGLSQQKYFIEKMDIKSMGKTTSWKTAYMFPSFECLCHLEEMTGLSYSKETDDNYADANIEVKSKITASIDAFIKKYKMEIYGGDKGKDELVESLIAAVKAMNKHKNTPWESVVRRLPILVRLKIYYGQPPLANMVEPPHDLSKPVPENKTPKTPAKPPKSSPKPGQTPGKGPRASETK
jgi:hypothetical protein